MLLEKLKEYLKRQWDFSHCLQRVEFIDTLKCRSDSCGIYLYIKL